MTDSASVLKELRKLPDNKVCMDCTDKLPSFICLELGTFVCTTCAGIHREFGHHIKAVTLSIFTPEEVELVAAGGNQNAKKIWLAKWTPAVFPQPGPLDKANIREFIKLKYLDKLWYAMPTSGALAVPESSASGLSAEPSQASPTANTLAMDPVDQYKSPFEAPKVNPVDNAVSWRANFDQFDAAVNKLNKSLDILQIQEQSAQTPSRPAESQYQQSSDNLITFDLLTGAMPPSRPQEQPQTQYIVRESSPPKQQNQEASEQPQQYIVKEQPPQYTQQQQQSPQYAHQQQPQYTQQQQLQYTQQPQQSPQQSPSNYHPGQRVAGPPSPSMTYQQYPPQMTQSPPMMPHMMPQMGPMPSYPYGTQFMPQMMPPMGGAVPVYLNQYGQPMAMPPMPMGAQPMMMPPGPNAVPVMLAPGNPKATQGMPMGAQPIIVNQYGQPVTLPPGVQPIPIMLPPGVQPPGMLMGKPGLISPQATKVNSGPSSAAQPLSDYELAKRLQEEENRQAGTGARTAAQPAKPAKEVFRPMSDEDYARRLQEEENTKGGSGSSGYTTKPSVLNPGRGAYFQSDEELARQLAQEDDDD